MATKLESGGKALVAKSLKIRPFFAASLMQSNVVCIPKWSGTECKQIA